LLRPPRSPAVPYTTLFRSLHAPAVRDRAAGVHQAGQQPPPLRLRRAQVGGGHVLVAEHPDRAQQRLDTAVVVDAPAAARPAVAAPPAVDAGGRGYRRRDETGLASAGAPAGADVRKARDESGTADHAP